MTTFLQSRWYMRGRLGYSLIWIVWHTTESPEGYGGALANAQYSQRRPDEVSFHAVFDAGAEYDCVAETDTAYAARNPGNLRGYHMEMCGAASQTAAQWRDRVSLATIDNAAKRAADVSKRRAIPPRWLSDADLWARRPGHTTHAQLTRVFAGTHTDPGPNFPFDFAMARVQHWLNPTPPKPTPPPPPPLPITGEEDMTFYHLASLPGVNFMTNGQTTRWMKTQKELEDWTRVKLLNNPKADVYNHEFAGVDEQIVLGIPLVGEKPAGYTGSVFPGF